MFQRFIFLIFCLVEVALSDEVEMEVSQIKAIGKSGTKFKMTAKCTFSSMEPTIPADGATFSLQLDRPTTKFGSKQVSVQSSGDTSYIVTNIKDITKKKFVITIAVQFNAPPFCFPVGTCRQMEGTTTSTTSTAPTSTTTQGPTTTESGFGDIEYLENNDMESSNFTDNWFCVGGCTLEPSTDSYTGTQSAKVTNRDQNWKGLSQFVSLTPGLRYSLSGFIKLLNTENNSMYHTAELMLLCQNNRGDKVYLKFGNNRMTQPGIWTEIGAILTVPTGFNTFRMYVQVFGLADYVADHFSLREVPDIVDWRTKAEARIEQIRKADISISVTSSSALPANLTMEVRQTSHEFAFGSAVGATEIVDTEDAVLQKYQEFFYDNFEWAVLANALKWRLMEWTEGVINYDRPTKAINALRSNGCHEKLHLKVSYGRNLIAASGQIRGHCVVWGVEKNVPAWLKDFSQEDTLAAITTRINGVIGNTTGLLEHWDVNNENLHGDYFEKSTGDANITMKMFQDVHALDPNAELFLNDFGIIETRSCQKATAIKEQARLFQDAGIPIHGIGIQSHIKNSDLDITAMKERLDKVAQSGLPIWITEFSVEETNETKKATALEDALTLYFSHPAVEGILLWGFWNGRIFAESAALVEGPDLTPNAAGTAYQTLYKQTWRTIEVHNVIDTNPIDLSGFKGDYTVTIKQDGVAITSQNFTLGSSGATVIVNLT